RDAPQDRALEHDLDALAHLGDEPGLSRRRPRLWLRLRLPDQGQGNRRDEEGGGIDSDGPCPTDPLDEETGYGGAGDLRRRARDFEFGVAFDEIRPVHQNREVRLIRDIEEDGEDAGE